MPQIEYETIGRSVILEDISHRIAHLGNLPLIMEEAAQIVYAATEEWFDSKGEGSWPELSRDTVFNKIAQGAAEPSRPLYAFGNLRASVISRTGPHSFFIPLIDGVAFGVDWTEGRGYQIADVLSEGATGTGRGNTTTIPARPIWPPLTSTIGVAMMAKIGRLILTPSPAFRGAGVSRGAGGRFVSMK